MLFCRIEDSWYSQNAKIILFSYYDIRMSGSHVMDAIVWEVNVAINGFYTCTKKHIGGYIPVPVS